MERDNKEWLNEYPTLKQVSPVNAFKVPAYYFLEMEGRIMDEIKLEEFKQANPANGFTVPENYFNNLTENIQSRIAIDEVLDTNKGFTVPENYFEDLTLNIQSRIVIDELLNIDEGFTVPQNYFEELTGNIESRVAIDELLHADKGFAVPENYFDELSENIEARIAVEELMGEEAGFNIPENYFEGLESRILQNTVGTSAPAKPKQVIVRKLWATAAFKYASAACISIVMGAAILLTEFNDTAIHNRSDVHKALAKVSKSDLEDYLELSGDASTVLENSDPNSLSNLLNVDTEKQDLN